MSVERKPIAFGDLRGWIWMSLRSSGELREIGAEVDWNIELGTVMRLAQGVGDGPALLFNNIKEYNTAAMSAAGAFSGAAYRAIGASQRCSGLAARHPSRELVKICRNILNRRHSSENRGNRPGQGKM